MANGRTAGAWRAATLACGATLLAAVALAADGEGRDALVVEWLDCEDRPFDPARGALPFSMPESRAADPAADPGRFRLRVRGGPTGPSVSVSLISIDRATGRVRDRLDIGPLAANGAQGMTSPWIVLVSDRADRRSSRLAGKALHAALRDRITAEVRIGASRPLLRSIQAGRLPDEAGSPDASRLSFRVIVLRSGPGGAPFVGGDAAGLREIIDHQITVLSEVLAPCSIAVVDPDEVEAVFSDPPLPSLIAVGDEYGLPSAGGMVRLMADGRRLGPWKIGAGYTPSETARFITHELETAGLEPRLSENPRRPGQAFAGADIVVRNAAGFLARLETWPDAPLSTETRQSVRFGEVGLDDGLDAYDESSACVGTLEERSLVKALGDGDPRTIDVFIVNAFSRMDKEGEAFVRKSGLDMANTVILTVRGLARARQSYALAHELGHVLLDDLGHPDARGDRRPELLMHSTASSALDGPKRLSAAECAKMRRAIEGSSE